jgi:hypothetical protein
MCIGRKAGDGEGTRRVTCEAQNDMQRLMSIVRLDDNPLPPLQHPFSASLDMTSTLLTSNPKKRPPATQKEDCDKKQLQAEYARSNDNSVYPLDSRANFPLPQLQYRADQHQNLPFGVRPSLFFSLTPSGQLSTKKFTISALTGLLYSLSPEGVIFPLCLNSISAA